MALEAKPIQRSFSAVTPSDSRWAGPFLSQCPLRVDLDPWSFADTRAFIDTALQNVGQEKSVFDHNALELLHDLSDRSPAADRPAGRTIARGGGGRSGVNHRRHDRGGCLSGTGSLPGPGSLTARRGQPFVPARIAS